MAPLDQQADRLQAAVAAIQDLGPRMDAAGPWALAELYGTEAEAHWGPPELLAHLDEMLPYWLGHVERLIDGANGGTGPVPFGRTAEDTLRVGLIGRDREMPLRELLSRLQSEGARVARRMRELTPADVVAVGVHPTRGEFTVEALFERFLTAHLEDHVNQLRDILAERGA